MRGRPFSEAGLFFFTESKAVETVFEGVAVARRCAMADGKSGSAVRFAELGAFDGVVFAGVAGGRVGGAGCHDEASIMRHCKWLGVVKKAAANDGRPC